MYGAGSGKLNDSTEDRPLSMLKPIVAAALLFFCNVSAASDLNGFWQHPKDPVWLEVNEAMGTGIAVRNDDDPSSVGFAVLKEVVTGPKEEQWSGQGVCASAGRLQKGHSNFAQRQNPKNESQNRFYQPLSRVDQSGFGTTALAVRPLPYQSNV